MAQHYSYVLLKELIWLLTEESHAEQFHQHFGYFWIKYYSLCSITDYDEYLDSLNVKERSYLESETIRSHYFEHPPHIELAVRLYAWKVFGQYPQYSSTVDGYNNSLLKCTVLDEYSEQVISLLCEEKLRDVLLLLGEHGIYHLLGLRHTGGSIFMLYPPKHLLTAQFQIPNNPKSKLTVGARALSKHCIRCKQNWVSMRGPEMVQNDYAIGTIHRILEHCIWINIHMLPHDITCLEVREGKGFGARWDLTEHFFRGFVEPFMEDGHQKGWIHNDFDVCLNRKENGEE